MLVGFFAALSKDFRLLFRDRVGLVFMTLAPVVVITVAGLSLSNLYGPKGGSSPFVLPLVDQDGGRIGRAITERLHDNPAVRVTLVAEPSAARALVRAKQMGAALIVPAGTSAALAAGRRASSFFTPIPLRRSSSTSFATLCRKSVTRSKPRPGTRRWPSSKRRVSVRSRHAARSSARSPISVAISMAPRRSSRRRGAMHRAPAARASAFSPRA